MSAVAPVSVPFLLTEEPIFRLTVAQYHQLIQSGVLGDSDPVELVEGALLYKTSRNTPHATAVRRCRRTIAKLLPGGFFYDSEQAITLADGEPEPDGAVVRGDEDDYAGRHPGPADVSLVIEVSDSTLARDRGIKRRSYARAGIPAYWLINLIDCQVEVYADPDPAAVPEPTYRRRDVYAGGAAVPLAVPGRKPSSVPAASLLPPA